MSDPTESKFSDWIKSTLTEVEADAPKATKVAAILGRLAAEYAGGTSPLQLVEDLIAATPEIIEIVEGPAAPGTDTTAGA